MVHIRHDSVFAAPYDLMLMELSLATAELSDASTDPGFPLNESMVLAAFESISYCRDEPSVMLWNCTRCLWEEVAGFLPEMTVYDPTWDVFSFVGYFPQWKASIVAIR